jgi:hypothetical protein
MRHRCGAFKAQAPEIVNDSRKLAKFPLPLFYTMHEI